MCLEGVSSEGKTGSEGSPSSFRFMQSSSEGMDRRVRLVRLVWNINVTYLGLHK